MKQKLLLKSLVLLFALIVGSTSVWAAEETFTFNTDAGLAALGIEKPSTGAGTNLGDNVYYSGDVSLSATSGSTATRVWNSSGTTDLRIYSGGKFTITAPGNITSIVLTGSTVNGFSCGENGTFSAGTWSGSSTTVELTATGTEKINTITVTYTTGAKTDPSITFNNGSVRIGKTLNLSTLFSSNSLGAVTYSIIGGNSYATIDGSTLTGVAEGNVTVQASQEATGSYNAKTATATISVIDPALSSIAITTAPTKTVYDEGELFDATDMVVTATFADASTEDVTASCTWTPSGALTTSDTQVTISYTYNAVTKTATQDITVNAYVQPTEFDIALNNTLFGTSYSGSASGITDDAPVIGTLNHVTVTYAGSGSHYINNSQIRFYPNNKLSFTAPVGHVITKIEFTSAGTWAATINSDKGTYTSSTKTWAGVASTVLFTGSGSSRCDMSKATITLSTTAPITPAYTRTTYVTTAALDFSDVDGLKAYAATAAAGGVVNFDEVGAVPASTPLMLIGTAGKTYNVPVVASASAPAANLLKAGDGTTVFDGSTFDYILYSDGLFYKITSGTVATTKAYLHCTSDPTTGGGARGLDVVFGDETAINALENATKVDNGAIYDLSGRRVENPTKGIYIMNGKKVIFK